MGQQSGRGKKILQPRHKLAKILTNYQVLSIQKGNPISPLSPELIEKNLKKYRFAIDTQYLARTKINLKRLKIRFA